MKKILIFAVLLYSMVAKLCAQTCNTCQGGIIAQCPTGAAHDVKNVYMCFKDASVLGFAESTDCKLAITNNSQITFKPHKSVVIHENINLIMPVLNGIKLLFGNFKQVSTIQTLDLSNPNTLNITLKPGINKFDYFFCTDSCQFFSVPLSSIIGQIGSGNSGIDIEFKASSNPYGTTNMPDAIWELNVTANEYDHPSQTPYTGISAGLATARAGKAHAYIKYGGTKGVLDKPLIFVDGIDFSNEQFSDQTITPNGSNYESNIIRHGSTGWDVLITGREEATIDVSTGQVETFGLYPTEFQKLLEKGYDIIMLDFAEGATYMQKNAALLQKLINRVHDVTDKDIVLIGASMGGQICRYALTKMETNGESHCVTHYVSFDSPNQGANIPLFMQATAWTLFDYKINNTPAVSDAWASINLPAALQLLQEPLQSAVNAGKINLTRNGLLTQATGFIGNNNYGLRNSFVADLEKQGSYSKNARNLAISCGSIKGTPQSGLGTVGGEKMYGVDLEAEFKLIKPKIPLGSLGLFTLAGNSNPNTKVGQFYYNQSFGSWTWGYNTYPIGLPRSIMVLAIPNIDLTGASLKEHCLKRQIPIYSEYVANVNSGVTMQPLDNAPGGFRDDLIRLIDDYVKLAQKLIPKDLPFFLNKNPNLPLFKTSFISTISALDLKGVGLFQDLSVNPEQFYKNKQTPFEAFYAPKNNLAHVQLDNQMIDSFLLPQLKNFGIDNRGDLTNTYNYGHQRNRITNITIKNAGKLWVNEVGVTGYVVSNPEAATKTGLFDIFTADCGPINVQDGGEMRLGSINSTQSGNLTINLNTTVNVLKVKANAGGSLNMYNNSILFVGKGGKLKATQGGCTLKKNAQIVVQSGGEFTIASEFATTLSDSAKVVVEKGGKLILEGDIAFNLLSKTARILIQNGGELIVRGSIKVNGDGFIEFEKGNIFTPKVQIVQITGDNKSKRFIQINADATLKVENVKFYIKQGTINYAQNASIMVKNSQTVFIQDIKAEGNNNNEVAFNLQECKDNYIRVSASDFNNVQKGIWIQNKNDGKLEATKSTFTHCTYGIINTDAGNAGHYISESCLFIKNAIGCDFRNQSGTISVQNSSFLENDYGLNLAAVPSKKTQFRPQIINVSGSTFGKNYKAGIVTSNIPALVVSSSTFYEHNNNKNYSVGLDIEDKPIDPNYDAFVECEKVRPCFGIYNARNSNIVLKYGTLFKDNNYGVFKDLDDKLRLDALVIECTTFNNNFYAVKGFNIEVQADASSLQQNSKTIAPPNTFIQGIDGRYFFDITYTEDPNIIAPTTIYLRQNYWKTTVNATGLTTGNDPDPMTISFKKDFTNYNLCEHCIVSGNCITYDASDFLFKAPRGCGLPYTPPGGGVISDDFSDLSGKNLCSTPISGGYAGKETALSSQFKFAYYSLFDPKSNIDNVMEGFTRVAMMPIKKEDSGECAQYIRVARAFTDYSLESKVDLEIGKVQQKAPIVASIYPNPADNMLQVNYDKGAFTVNVLDLKGQVIYKNEAEYGLEINTSTWQSGVYQVSITDKTTGNQSVKKVVIMRGN